MLSTDIRNVARALDVFADPATVSPPPPGFLRKLAGILKSHAEAARELEQAAVAQRHHLCADDLSEGIASGKVALLPARRRGEDRP